MRPYSSIRDTMTLSGVLRITLFRPMVLSISVIPNARSGKRGSLAQPQGKRFSSRHDVMIQAIRHAEQYLKPHTVALEPIRRHSL